MNRAKKILGVLGTIVYLLFVVACILAVAFVIGVKKSEDGIVSFFGKQVRIVASSSMESSDDTDVSAYPIGSIPLRSAVVVELVPDGEAAAQEWYANLAVGDVLTIRYVYGNAVTLSHRIISIEPAACGGYTIRLQGDNHSDGTGALVQTIETADGASVNRVIGKVTSCHALLGKLLYGLKQPICMILLVIVPCAILIVLQIFNVVKLLLGKSTERKNETAAQNADGQNKKEI